MVLAYLAVQTQWRIVNGYRIGLDYAGVEAGLRLSGETPTPELFRQLQIIERAILAVNREKADGEKNRHTAR